MSANLAAMKQIGILLGDGLWRIDNLGLDDVDGLLKVLLLFLTRGILRGQFPELSWPGIVHLQQQPESWTKYLHYALYRF